jgi:hypothetical protein
LAAFEVITEDQLCQRKKSIRNTKPPRKDFVSQTDFHEKPCYASYLVGFRGAYAWSSVEDQGPPLTTQTLVRSPLSDAAKRAPSTLTRSGGAETQSVGLVIAHECAPSVKSLHGRYRAAEEDLLRYQYSLPLAATAEQHLLHFEAGKLA